MAKKPPLGPDLPFNDDLGGKKSKSGDAEDVLATKKGGTTSSGGTKQSPTTISGTSAPDVVAGPDSTEAFTSAEAGSRRALGRPKGSKNKPKDPSRTIHSPAGPGILPIPRESITGRPAEVGVDLAIDPLPPVAPPSPPAPTRRPRFSFLRIGA